MRQLGLLGILCACFLVACGPGPMAPTGTDDSALTSDLDRDGIADAFEQTLAEKLAPEVRLAPEEIDWTRPANVDWYLKKVAMRFDHPHCFDHQVEALGKVTQANIWRQSHPTDTWWCGHSGTTYHSSASHKQFFLQPPDDSVHAGLADPSGWRVYAHVKKSKFISGGFDVQYWFFYAYNDAYSVVNHEADWEHITVTSDSDGHFVSAYYAAHSGGTRHSASQLTFDGTHPVVYSADGTHASYTSAGTFPSEVEGFPDHTYDGGPVWHTWENVVNVGEKTRPLEGQSFIRYGGRWGEVGNIENTSGPVGPAFHGGWNGY